MKPESNFKGLRTFLTHLPIDYYILLQKGYDERSTNSSFSPTNYIYCENIPLLSHKKTYFKSSLPIKTIFLEDVYKCSNRFEAEKLLDDQYAVEELLRHLNERYGEIDEHFFVNYDTDSILSRVGMGARINEGEMLAVKSPLDQELEETLSKLGRQNEDKASEVSPDSDNMLDANNFESLMMSLDKDDFLGKKDKEGFKAFTKDELVD